MDQAGRVAASVVRSCMRLGLVASSLSRSGPRPYAHDPPLAVTLPLRHWSPCIHDRTFALNPRTHAHQAYAFVWYTGNSVYVSMSCMSTRGSDMPRHPPAPHPPPCSPFPSPALPSPALPP